jgi:hypothetical protein
MVGPVIGSSFLNKSPEYWNELPDEIQNCPYRVLLKRQLKRQLKRHYLDKYTDKVVCGNTACSDHGHCTQATN